MLNHHRPHTTRQHGLVLVLALIVLAAMSIAAVGLMRGVFGSNRVAANLAFQQAAVQAADVGVERAVAWLEQMSVATVPGVTPPNAAVSAPAAKANWLYGNVSPSASSPYSYSAVRGEPGVNQTWESYWLALKDAGLVNTLPTDANGNTTAFAVHRLCRDAGPPDASFCEAAPNVPAAIRTSSKSSAIKLKDSSQVYYRITVRVEGPRNAVSFVQTVVAI